MPRTGQEGLPEGVVVIDDLLSPAECRHWIEAAETEGFRIAPITTGGGPEVVSVLRNNGRVMFEDPALAGALWARLEPHLPARLPTSRHGHWWQALGLNERFRSYRYEPGQYFHWHQDGSFRRNDWECSLLSVILYLNDDFEGGHTEFDARHTELLDEALDGEASASVAPRPGRALVFPHPHLHQGAPVTRGRKYVLRSDVMYRQV